jgi:hypothetical protein
MGLSIVIYQALLYVAIFIVAFLLISYLSNKIRRNGRNSSKSNYTPQNYMSSIQRKIAMTNREERFGDRNEPQIQYRPQSVNSNYIEDYRMNRTVNNYRSPSNKYHYVPPKSPGNYDQHSPRSYTMFNESQVATFR